MLQNKNAQMWQSPLKESECVKQSHSYLSRCVPVSSHPRFVIRPLSICSMYFYKMNKTNILPRDITLWNLNTENFRVTLKIHEIAQDKGIE